MAKDMELMLRIKADSDQAKKDIEEARKKLEELRKTAENLKKQIAEKEKLGIDTTEAQKNLGEITKKCTEFEKVLKDLGEKGGDALAQLAKSEAFKTVKEGLQKIGEVCNKTKEELIRLGEDFINSAATIGKYRSQIMNLSGSIEQAQKNLKAIGDYSKTAQPFDLKNLTETGAILAKYHQDVGDVLPVLADFAAAHKVDVLEPAVLVGRALDGQKRGLSTLMTQYSITTPELVKYGAATLKSGEIDIKAAETKAALLKVMMEFKGSAQQAADGWKATTNQFNTAIEEVKVAFGEKLLPIVTAVTKEITSLINKFNELPPSTKDIVVDIGLVVGALTLVGATVGGAVAGIGLMAASVIQLGATLGGITGIVAGVGTGIAMIQALFSMTATVISGVFVPALLLIAPALPIVAIGVYIKAMNDLKIAQAELMQQDITKELKDQADHINEIHKYLPQATTAQLAYNQAQKEGFQNILNQKDGLKELQSITRGLTDDEKRMFDKRAEDATELKRRLEDDKNLSGGEKIINEEKIKDLEQSIGYETELINKIKDEKNNVYDAEKAWKAKTAASYTAPELHTTVDTSQFSQLMSQQKNLTEAQEQGYRDELQHLEEFKTKYILNDEQILEIKKRQIEAQKKLDEEGTKASKEQLDTQNKDWKEFFGKLEVQLTAGKINQQQYNDAIANYYNGITNDLKGNTTLRTEMEKAYYAGVNKLSGESAKENKKNLQEETKDLQTEQKARVAAGEELLKQEEQEKKAQEERIQQTKAIQELEASIRDNSVKSIQSEVEALQKKIEIQQRIIASESSLGEVLKLRFDSGQKLNDIELKNLDIYLKDKKALQDMNDQYQALLNKSTQDFQNKLQAQEAYNKLLVERGEKTQQEADREANSYKKAYADAWKGYIEPIMQEAKEKGFDSLEQWKKDAVLNYVNSVQSMTKNTDGLKTSMDNVTASTNNAATAANNLSSNLGTATEQAGKLSEKLNNISGATGAMTKSGLGGFSSSPGGLGQWDNSGSGLGAGQQGAGGQGNMPNSDKKGQAALQSGYTSGLRSGNDYSHLQTPTYNSPGQSNNQSFSSDASRSEEGWNRPSSVGVGDNIYTTSDMNNWAAGLGQRGFDNPVHDSMAFKAMENLTSEFAIPLVTKSMKDMVMNMLSGMVSSVSNIKNSSVTDNSQSSTSQSITNNYNTSFDNKQIKILAPLQQKINEINAITTKFRRPK